VGYRNFRLAFLRLYKFVLNYTDINNVYSYNMYVRMTELVVCAAPFAI